MPIFDDTIDSWDDDEFDDEEWDDLELSLFDEEEWDDSSSREMWDEPG
jgi:hypothetical protein